jgi:hypothetical protein
MEEMRRAVAAGKLKRDGQSVLAEFLNSGAFPANGTKSPRGYVQPVD